MLGKKIEAKLFAVKTNRFELAASSRDLEYECKKYISIKRQFNIEKSMFYNEHEYLVYLYLGISDNDKIVKNLLKKGS